MKFWNLNANKNMQNTQENTQQDIMEMAKKWMPPQKKKSGRKSKLIGYLDTIRYMRSARHLSYKDIHAFVLDTGMKVSYPTLMQFIKRNLGKNKSK